MRVAIVEESTLQGLPEGELMALYQDVMVEFARRDALKASREAAVKAAQDFAEAVKDEPAKDASKLDLSATIGPGGLLPRLDHRHAERASLGDAPVVGVQGGLIRCLTQELWEAHLPPVLRFQHDTGVRVWRAHDQVALVHRA